MGREFLQSFSPTLVQLSFGFTVALWLKSYPSRADAFPFCLSCTPQSQVFHECSLRRNQHRWSPGPCISPADCLCLYLFLIIMKQFRSAKSTEHNRTGTSTAPIGFKKERTSIPWKALRDAQRTPPPPQDITLSQTGCSRLETPGKETSIPSPLSLRKTDLHTPKILRERVQGGGPGESGER